MLVNWSGVLKLKLTQAIGLTLNVAAELNSPPAQFETATRTCMPFAASVKPESVKLELVAPVTSTPLVCHW